MSVKTDFITDARANGYYLGVAKHMISVYDSPEGDREVARLSWDKKIGTLDFAGTREDDKFRRVISVDHVRAFLGLEHRNLRRPMGGGMADSISWAWEHNHVPSDV